MTPLLARPLRPGTLRLHLEPSAAEVLPGRRARFLLRIENRGDGPQDVILRLEPPGDGWTALVPVRSVAVQPLSTVAVVLRVDAPSTAQPGERATFRVLAAGSDRPDRAVTLVAEAIVGS